ncbi:MAG: hypothetical protein ACO3LE_02215, partial [Bdellovibrionota bacterium]
MTFYTLKILQALGQRRPEFLEIKSKKRVFMDWHHNCNLLVEKEIEMKKFIILTAILSLNLTLLTGSDAFARQNYQISGENSKNKTVVLGEPLQPGSKSFHQPADSNDEPSEAASIA